MLDKNTKISILNTDNGYQICFDNIPIGDKLTKQDATTICNWLKNNKEIIITSKFSYKETWE